MADVDDASPDDPPLGSASEAFLAAVDRLRSQGCLCHLAWVNDQIATVNRVTACSIHGPDAIAFRRDSA